MTQSIITNAFDQAEFLKQYNRLLIINLDPMFYGYDLFSLLTLCRISREFDSQRYELIKNAITGERFEYFRN